MRRSEGLSCLSTLVSGASNARSALITDASRPQRPDLTNRGQRSRRATESMPPRVARTAGGRSWLSPGAGLSIADAQSAGRSVGASHADVGHVKRLAPRPFRVAQSPKGTEQEKAHCAVLPIVG